MKTSKILRTSAAFAAACALAFSLASCSAEPEGNKEASANRQCLSALNSRVAELQTVMQDFETAASQQNIVAMKTQADKAEDLIGRIRDQEATPALKDVKGQYVQAIDAMDQAMDSYVALYEQAQAGDISSDDVKAAVADIQATYDEGVEMLEEADDAVAALAE